MRRDVGAWVERERSAIQRQRLATERRQSRRSEQGNRCTNTRSMRICSYRAFSSLGIHVQRQLPAGAGGMAGRGRRRASRLPPSSASTSTRRAATSSSHHPPLCEQAGNTHAYVYMVPRARGLWRCHERDDEPPLQVHEVMRTTSVQKCFVKYSLRTPRDHR